MKATKQYFPVVLFITLYKEVLTFESSVTNQMKATEQQFTVVSFLLGNLRFKTTVNGYGWTSTRDLG